MQLDRLTLALAVGMAACTSTPEPESEGLDLREANVVAVEVEDQGERSYRFDVTLHHDDDGEAPNFADWWQVEDLQGNVLGKRVLLHAHSSQPFTRSEVIAIPRGVEVVVVRGHDMLHAFGGQTAVVRLADGRVDFVMDDRER